MKAIVKTKCTATGLEVHYMDDKDMLRCVDGIMYRDVFGQKPEKTHHKCKNCKGTGLKDKVVENYYE